MTASVAISNVRKSYGKVEVIHGVSLDIDDGQFVVLVGPSGCGKSTLLRMIAGLETITAGDIRIDDRIVNGLEPKDRDIAMVFQNYALYPQMTVAQNMGFALELSGVSKAERLKIVGHAADILGLEPLLERKPAQLSGGQRQRVAMGRAIVRDPKVFLFDEPLSNLDAKLRVQMRAEIKSLHQRLNSTIVYVTHDQIEAMTLADKIVVLNAGIVEQVGAPLDLYDNPANLFVAEFIGSPAMNLFTGMIESGATPNLILEGGARIPIPKQGVAKVKAAGSVVFGIRPEHVEIDPDNGVSATIKVVEPTGSETHVLAGIGHAEIVCVFRERIAARAGETIRLSFASKQGHFFDHESGIRLNNH